MNPYDTLNVRSNASKDEITAAFHKLLEKYDTKNYPGDPYFAQKRLNNITEAYNILSDPIKRREYDKSHEVHTNLHKKETSSKQDAFSAYYNKPKTTEHIHNDYEIAQDKYNNYKNSLNNNNPISSDQDYEDINEKIDNYINYFYVFILIVLFFGVTLIPLITAFSEF